VENDYFLVLRVSNCAAASSKRNITHSNTERADKLLNSGGGGGGGGGGT